MWRRWNTWQRQLLETLSVMLDVRDWAKYLFGPEAVMPPLVPLRLKVGLEAQGEGGGGEGAGGGGSGGGGNGGGQALLSQPPQIEQQQQALQQHFPPMPLREVDRAQLAEVE